MPARTWPPSPAAPPPAATTIVVNGQKTWSTRALFANWLFGLFRSDPASSRHHGLSYLLVPLDAKGITIRPIRALNGKSGLCRGVLRRCARAGGPAHRRRGPGLERGHGHRRFRARPAAAFPGALPAHRAKAGAAVPAPPRPRPTATPGSATPCCRPGWTPRPTTWPSYHTVSRVLQAAAHRGRGEHQQDLLVRTGPADARDRDAHPGPARRTAPTTPKCTTGSRDSCSRRPARSTPAATRSSATSSPSACSACRSPEGDGPWISPSPTTSSRCATR
jgi:hypothetical protein